MPCMGVLFVADGLANEAVILESKIVGLLSNITEHISAVATDIREYRAFSDILKRTEGFLQGCVWRLDGIARN